MSSSDGARDAQLRVNCVSQMYINEKKQPNIILSCVWPHLVANGHRADSNDNETISQALIRDVRPAGKI